MKTYKIIFWTASIIIFILEAVMPLSTLIFVPKYFNAGTKPLGYPDYFAYSLIIFKTLGASVILLPKIPSQLKEWAYAGLMFNLVFAVISHLAVDQNISYVLSPVAVAAILVLSYISYHKLTTTAKSYYFSNSAVKHTIHKHIVKP